MPRISAVGGLAEAGGGRWASVGASIRRRYARAVAIDSEFWASRRVLVTGHTGFKGAWLSLWLQRLGAEVSGLAPAPPTRPSLYELARVGAGMAQEHAADIRDAAAVRDAFAHARPEIVLHLAAQPLVRRSLIEPANTFEVNVLGTVNVLDAVRASGAHARAIVAVTSDKCYAHPPAGNGGEPRRFVEEDALGGSDPYSSSKACAELVVAAYRGSYFSAQAGPQLASARAGNVIGGGDWGEDRLLADVVRAVEAGEPVRVRNPDAVRPWQHVLNPLSGYLLLAQECARSATASRAWNFGPRASDEQPVRVVLERLRELWRGQFSWELDGGAHPPEAQRLALDSSAAEAGLAWEPRWDLQESLARVVEWHEQLRAGGDARELTLAQIEAFETGLA
jgi:CDP-glucose 4,6-dehydratase